MKQGMPRVQKVWSYLCKDNAEAMQPLIINGSRIKALYYNVLSRGNRGTWIEAEAGAKIWGEMDKSSAGDANTALLTLGDDRIFGLEYSGKDLSTPDISPNYASIFGAGTITVCEHLFDNKSGIGSLTNFICYGKMSCPCLLVLLKK